MVVLGHVLHGSIPSRNYERQSLFQNIRHLWQQFNLKPAAGKQIVLDWHGQLVSGRSEPDGFFRLEWVSAQTVPAGWHPVEVACVDSNGNQLAGDWGELMVPHVTQLAFISDIDDTILISHSATIFRRLGLLLSRHPRTRRAFADVALHYGLLANAQTSPDEPNPFFYISSSEWNLFDDLVEFFQYNKLPRGIFLLNQLKRWYQLPFSGKTKHAGKTLRILRILEAFPLQRFVLLGDNSQKDPAIYLAIVEKFPDRIAAVYIRNMRPGKMQMAAGALERINGLGVPTCLFQDTSVAITHARQIGLIAAQATDA